MMQRILYGVVAIIIAIGFKFYNKSSHHDDLKENLAKICQEDQECLAAVNDHYEQCFEKHYILGGRRTSAHLNQEQFLTCFNQLAGKPIFVTKENDDQES